MKGIVDRIEDGRIAVIDIDGGGQMLVPVENLGIKVNEGDHLKIKLKQDPESREKMRKEINDIKEELLERTRKKEEKDHS
ncbi:MAG: DUF3006 domain-containing protein [Elusimicrobiota bacterium]|nr:DUF3006 domain-containing protein [Elusimicrobiota bacterium]